MDATSVENRDIRKEIVQNWEEDKVKEIFLQPSVIIAKVSDTWQENVKMKELKDNKEEMEMDTETEVDLETKVELGATTVKNSAISLEIVPVKEKKEDKMVIKEEIEIMEVIEEKED